MGLRDLWRNTSLAQQGPYATINHDAGFSLIMNAEPGNLYGMQNMQQARAAPCIAHHWTLCRCTHCGFVLKCLQTVDIDPCNPVFVLSSDGVLMQVMLTLC